MRISTTDRKYYDTEKKINTLGAYASELLPAAKDLQAEIKEQQSIKMDKLGIEARMRMNDATNEWRLANQSNPNDQNALQDLQNQYDSILSDYRNEIDPLYRSQWDITGNKLKGAFDLENQAWGFKQRQENAKNDMADSMESYLKLAYSYGQSGSLDKALVDFQQSYDKLLDYGAKNLGTEDAAVALKNYQKDFYISYLDGFVEKNPSQALKMLNSKEFYGILDSRDFKRFKNYAKARQKEINNEIYAADFQKFRENPTEENKEKLYKNYPNMSKTAKKAVEDYYNQVVDYEAQTTYQGLQEGIDAMDEISKADYQSDEERQIAVISYLNKVNASKNISEEDKIKLRSNASQFVEDEQKREMLQVNVSGLKELLGWNLKHLVGSEKNYYMRRRGYWFDESKSDMFPSQPTNIRMYNRMNPYINHDVIDKKRKDAVSAQLGYMAVGDVEGAKNAMKEYKRDMLEYLNPEIKGKKAGDVVVINGSIYKIVSIDDDVVLENK